MRISPSNLLSELYSKYLPSALKDYLVTSPRPYSAFLKFSRMSLSDSVLFLASRSINPAVRSFADLYSMPTFLRNFKVSEFYTGLLTDSSFSCLDSAVFTMYGRAVFFAFLLNNVRTDLHKSSGCSNEPAIFINSGYRSFSHNESVGGVPNSNHTAGTAIDVACPVGVTFSTFLSFLNNYLFLYKSFYKDIEIIPYRKQRFIHISL